MTMLEKLPSPAFRYSRLSADGVYQRVKELSAAGFRRVMPDPTLYRGELFVGKKPDGLWFVSAIPHGSRGPHQ